VKVLVTGGTGFIGRNLMTALLARHSASDLVCLVKTSAIPAETAALERFRAAGIRIIMGDLDDPLVSREPAPPVDRVFHLAANIDTAVPENELRVNDTGTDNLLRWLAPMSRGARIMYTSSVAVHDRSGPAAGPITETSPYTPRTPYGLTKLRGEHILEAHAATDGFTYTTLRLATVYGPYSKAGGLFDLLFTMTEKGSLGGRIAWPGKTSIIHVEDTASLLTALAERPDAANQIYCTSNPDAPTVGELAQRIGRVSGHPVAPINLPDVIWSSMRAVTWSRLTRAMMPASMQLLYWRLSLIIDDGFWYDTRKLQTVWTTPPIDLDAGIRQMLAARAAR
jgi:UDP-glucose 4-epimerase